MENLPKFQLQKIKPFIITGVDYAGAINRLLNVKKLAELYSGQAFICILVCMTIKALHLELASDLSTETFRIALCRFISRRERIEQMHSDFGTNFVGAVYLFRMVDSFTRSTKYQRKCRDYITTRKNS